MPVRLHAFDLGVVGVYLVAITLFGLRFARGSAARDKSLRGYFLADRTAPWWAIGLSIVSAETSTLTIIGTPGLAFAGDFGFLQIVFGYMIGRVVVAAIFLPKYFQGEMLTAYQLIDRRFGHTLHKVTAGLFLLTRAAAEGVRVFAVSIVVGIAIGTGDVLSIGIISALTLLYTFEGGMAAVIWTDVVQMAIYVGGTVVAIWTLGQHVPGGWSCIHAVGAAAGKFHLLNFALNLTTTYTFWAGVLGGTFLTMASHGTDQLMVQRMLAAKDLGESRLALLSSGVVIFVQFALFLLIGAGLFVFYGLHPGAATGFANTNRIFPTFIVREMPVGVAGLLVAAILAAAMSNLSAALNSLASTTVVDFYMGFRPRADDRVARGDRAMGAGAVCGGGVLGARGRQGERGRDWAVDRFGGVWVPARSFPAGDADAVRYRVGGDCGYGDWVRAECRTVAVSGEGAVPRRSVICLRNRGWDVWDFLFFGPRLQSPKIRDSSCGMDVVCADRRRCHLRRRVPRQPPPPLRRSQGSHRRRPPPHPSIHFPRPGHDTGWPILRAFCEGWGIERSSTALPRSHPRFLRCVEGD